MSGLAVWARRVTSVCVVGGVLALAMPGPSGLPTADAASCAKDMASIGGDFCIDRYEARTVEVRVPKRAGAKPAVIREHSPFEPVDGVDVMAVVAKGRVPQGYISRDQASAACRLAGKRLCTDEEWLRACRGKRPTKFPYGETHVEGRCNDKGVSSFNMLFGPGDGGPPPQSAYDTVNMNDPRLNKMKGTVAASGKFAKCKNAWGVYDMVGNLHEWTAAASGTFRGGYYLDTVQNGEGCDYRTTAHNGRYHDYSTGFRCCQGGAEQQRVDREERARAKARDEAKPAAPAKKKPKKKG